GFEQEPNDRVEDATPLGERNSIEGRLAGADQDTFMLEVSGEPQLWRFQVQGDGVSGLGFLDISGRLLVHRAGLGGSQGVSMSNVLLLPGRHFLRVTGADAAYTLRTAPLGPPDDDGDRPAGLIEAEPNDDVTRAERLRLDEPRVVLLAEVDDTDLYRF